MCKKQTQFLTQNTHNLNIVCLESLHVLKTAFGYFLTAIAFVNIFFLCFRSACFSTSLSYYYCMILSHVLLLVITGCQPFGIATMATTHTCIVEPDICVRKRHGVCTCIPISEPPVAWDIRQFAINPGYLGSRAFEGEMYLSTNCRPLTWRSEFNGASRVSESIVFFSWVRAVSLTCVSSLYWT